MNLSTLARTATQVLKVRSRHQVIAVAALHCSCTNFVGQDWRKERLLPKNPNAYGPLSDLPDYTFLDGRRTPPSPNKVRRAVKHRAFAEKIMQYTAEMNFAVERHQRLQKDEEVRREEILSRKLKPKGQKPL